MSRRIPPRVRPTVPPPTPLVSGTQPRVLRSPPRPFFTLPDDDRGRVDRLERVRPGRPSRSRSTGRVRPLHPVQEAQQPVRSRSGSTVRAFPPHGVQRRAVGIFPRFLAGSILFALGLTVLAQLFELYRSRVTPGCASPGLYLVASHLGIPEICPAPDPLVANVTDFVAEQVDSGLGITTDFVLGTPISSVELRATNTALRNFTRLAKPVRSNAEEDLVLSSSEQWSKNPEYPDVQIYHSVDLLDQAKTYHDHAKAVNAGIDFLSNDLSHLFSISDSSAAAKYSPSIDSDLTQLKLDLNNTSNAYQNLSVYNGAATTHYHLPTLHLLKRIQSTQKAPLAKTLNLLKTFASTHKILLASKLAKSEELSKDVDLATESRNDFRESFQKAWKIWVRECSTSAVVNNENDSFYATTAFSSKTWVGRERSGYCAAFDPEPLRLASMKGETDWYLQSSGAFAEAATGALEELLGEFADLGARVDAAIEWDAAATYEEFGAVVEALEERVEERRELFRKIVLRD